MYNAIREIHEEFEKNELKHRVEQLGDTWALLASVGGDQAGYDFLFIKADDSDSDVQMRVYGVVKFPANRIENAYELLAEMNSSYRFLRFVIDKDGDVNAEYDFPVRYQPLGPGAMEIMIRTVQILDDCYPKLMRAIWA